MKILKYIKAKYFILVFVSALSLSNLYAVDPSLIAFRGGGDRGGNFNRGGDNNWNRDERRDSNYYSQDRRYQSPDVIVTDPDNYDDYDDYDADYDDSDNSDDGSGQDTTNNYYYYGQ